MGLFLKDVFAYTASLNIFHEQGVNEIPSPWPWENEIYRTLGQVETEELCRLFDEHRNKGGYAHNSCVLDGDETDRRSSCDDDGRSRISVEELLEGRERERSDTGRRSLDDSEQVTEETSGETESGETETQEAESGKTSGETDANQTGESEETEKTMEEEKEDSETDWSPERKALNKLVRDRRKREVLRELEKE